MKRMIWTCGKCGRNEYSESAMASHSCTKKELPVQTEEEKPQKLTQKKGAKRGRKSKKTNNKLD